MVERKIDALVVCSNENIYYASGFYLEGYRGAMAWSLMPQFLVLPREDLGAPTLIVNNCVFELAKRMSWVEDVRTYVTGSFLERSKEIKDYASTPIDAVTMLLKELNIANGNIGIEEDRISADIFLKIRNRLKLANLVEASDILKNMRLIKSEEEINRIKKAVEISEKGFLAARRAIESGASELEIMKAFMETAIKEGAYGFVQINMGSGSRSSDPISFPSDYKPRKGDFIRMDFGVKYKWYCSDIARCAAVGEVPAKFKKMYYALLNAQRKAIKMIKPGIKMSEIFKVGIKTAKVSGHFGEYARTNIGHHIGLELEEDPFIRPDVEMTLEPNMVLCVELPYYITGLVGMNIEDVVLVTEDGCEELSNIDRELWEV